MKITKLYKVCESHVEPIWGDSKQLCILIKEPGYYASKRLANTELKHNIIYNQECKQINLKK